jgi:hypothetical protein
MVHFAADTSSMRIAHFACVRRRDDRDIPIIVFTFSMIATFICRVHRRDERNVAVALFTALISATSPLPCSPF